MVKWGWADLWRGCRHFPSCYFHDWEQGIVYIKLSLKVWEIGYLHQRRQSLGIWLSLKVESLKLILEERFTVENSRDARF